MKRLKRRVALVVTALALATAVPLATAPPASAGWWCQVWATCGKVTNASNSKANLLILGENGVQYVLKPGQASTSRVWNTDKFFTQGNCWHVEYNTRFAGSQTAHTGGGWVGIAGRHNINDNNTNVIVYLGAGCPGRGW